jgi:outer membrane protein OmpA-like peptidoglycan-associated protein
MIMKSTIALSLSGVLVLSACADSTTRIQDPNYRAQNGAVAGALIGGILGASSVKNDKGRAALLGAALGAGVGGAIGSNLDSQAADLRNRFGNPNVTVTNMGDYLLVNMPDDLLFATGSATVNGALQADIRSVAANLISYPDSNIQVIGNTDNVGAAAFNQDLSQRRAVAVADILLGAGVPSSRLSAFGRGEDNPVASNLTDSGRAQNRRVEIIIRPK